ncbi:GntR family transcriptional regulator [Streptomyces sp. 5-10]|uniref:GntR family transcriptional regulator n=1 Tax=Streptomyces sp. 5-10 TaxID=878925 RepID=UPI00168BCE4A|nr:GntR family transcriptional regulator [Streptomyces sp. 5-10]MBD3004851.1 GntR family transcriptional regulator [Streptomyces sp. 5-10]
MTENERSPDSKTPLSQRVASYYRDRILAGVLKPGDELPGRLELMELHGEGGTSMGRATADKVIDLLAAQNLVVRRPRKPPVVADRTKYGTTLNERAASKRATGNALGVGETSKILDLGMIPCPPDIAECLNVEPGEQVLRRSRVNFRNGHPATMSTSYYTQETARVTPELAEPVSIPGGSRELAAERMGSPLDEGTEDVTARLATDAERSTLMLSGTFTVVMEDLRIVSLEDGRIIEVAKKVVPGDHPLRFRSSFKV